MCDIVGALLKSPEVISTGIPTYRDEAEKSIKQIPRLAALARNDGSLFYVEI